MVGRREFLQFALTHPTPHYPLGPTASTGGKDQLQGHRLARPVWVYDQPTGALDQVSDATGALGVAVGDGRHRHPAECVCVERQRLQRLQQPERRRLLSRNVTTSNDSGLGFGL